MTAAMWDTRQYAQFADERSRPFHELVARIPHVGLGATPSTVVDLGCGPGPLTIGLRSRWPEARIVGVDNDPAMLAAATGALAAVQSPPGNAGIEFAAGDLRTWTASSLGMESVDVIVANASLQWDLDHLARLPILFEQVTPGGWLAFQVPGNLDDPHHQAIREVRNRAHWRLIPAVAALPERTHVSKPATLYLDVLARLGASVDAWETSYVHVLQGDDPVLEWVKGTGLRPVLHALPDDAARDAFCAELSPLLRSAYPAQPYGTPFPFRRVFVVAQRPTR